MLSKGRKPLKWRKGRLQCLISMARAGGAHALRALSGVCAAELHVHSQGLLPLIFCDSQARRRVLIATIFCTVPGVEYQCIDAVSWRPRLQNSDSYHRCKMHHSALHAGWLHPAPPEMGRASVKPRAAVRTAARANNLCSAAQGSKVTTIAA